MTDPITEPGVYDLPMDTYHGDCCAGPSASSSGLRTLLTKSPAHYWATSPLNPDRIERKETAALNFGQATHSLLIEGVDLAEQFHILPEGFRSNATKKFANAIAAKAAAENAGRTAIKVDDAAKIMAMADALRAHPLAMAAFREGEPEKSLIWQDKETGVWLKARPDWLPNKLKTIPEYKTALDARLEPFSRDLFNYGYQMQAALMLEGVRIVTGRKPRGIFYIVQEKEPPYAIATYRLRTYDLEWGKIQIYKAIHVFAECIESGKWPSYPEKVQEIRLPAWAEIQLSRAEAAGEFTVEQKNERPAERQPIDPRTDAVFI